MSATSLLLDSAYQPVPLTGVAAVRFRTDSRPEPNPNQTSVQVWTSAKDWTGPEVRFGVQRLLDFPGPVQTCANLCKPQTSNFSLLQITIFAKKKIVYANLLHVNRGVVTALEPKGEIK
jgi:hypothetical protein